MTPPIDTAHLRALAQAAKGYWWIMLEKNGRMHCELRAEYAVDAHIAAASPDVVLGLLDRIDKLEEALRGLMSYGHAYTLCNGGTLTGCVPGCAVEKRRRERMDALPAKPAEPDAVENFLRANLAAALEAKFLRTRMTDQTQAAIESFVKGWLMEQRLQNPEWFDDELPPFKVRWDPALRRVFIEDAQPNYTTAPPLGAICPHGQLRRSCLVCEAEGERDRAVADRHRTEEVAVSFEAERNALQARIDRAVDCARNFDDNPVSDEIVAILTGDEGGK